MKVDVIIAGGQKCGTTALHHFLGQHSKIIVSNPKEIDYFNYDFNYNKGNSYYHSFFKHKPFFHKTRGYKLIEATPSYINGSLFCDIKQTAERIKLYNPEIKIICLVRNPIDRAYSAYNMFKKRYEQGRDNWWFDWFEKRIGYRPVGRRRSAESYSSFEFFIKEELAWLEEGEIMECPVLLNGKYIEQIKVFREVFNENLIVVKNELLDKETEEILNNITKFINVNKIDWNFLKTKKIFVGDYQKNISPFLMRELEAYYFESNSKLELLEGIGYNK
ncbi:sulfotransferase domain-containing protein [Winogradskyella rapida]|uniref:Sulfotransferase domain-containing protein n=1 Tax=Winogradskyella rapida TaxID=549701 RepID=A0ABW3KNQ5_9FLAO